MLTGSDLTLSIGNLTCINVLNMTMTYLQYHQQMTTHVGTTVDCARYPVNCEWRQTDRQTDTRNGLSGLMWPSASAVDVMARTRSNEQQQKTNLERRTTPHHNTCASSDSPVVVRCCTGTKSNSSWHRSRTSSSSSRKRESYVTCDDRPTTLTNSTIYVLYIAELLFTAFI